MAKQHNEKFVDLVISEANGSQIEGDFRFCTLSRSGSQRTINFRLPDEIQEMIVAAYENGKAVRIFA